MYDGSGSFAYDRNLDRNLDDETADTNNIMPTGTLLPFDLLTVDDGEADIGVHISAGGYQLPSYP